MNICAHQDIFTLGKTDRDLSGLAADVHDLGIPVWNSLSQEEDGVFVLLMAHPEGTQTQAYISWSKRKCLLCNSGIKKGMVD